MHRERTGQGQLVTTSLLRQGAYTIGFDVNVALMWGYNIQLGNRATMRNPTINNYTAGDGRRFWIVGLEADRHWPPLARAVGHPEWLTDPRYAATPGRAENAPELIAELDAIFATKSLDEWAEIFEQDPEFIWSPVNSVTDLIVDPQFFAAGGVVTVPDENGGFADAGDPRRFLRRRRQVPGSGRRGSGKTAARSWRNSAGARTISRHSSRQAPSPRVEMGGDEHEPHRSERRPRRGIRPVAHGR